MAINKVVYGDRTLIDLTSDTATSADVAQGKTFHDRSGTLRTGTASGGGVPLPSTIMAGNTPVLVDTNSYTCNMVEQSETNIHETGLVITVSKAGTYRFKWFASKQTDGTSRTDGYTRLYKNGNPVGSLHSFAIGGTSTASFYDDIVCNAGDSVEVWIAAGTWTFGLLGTYSGGGAYGFCACIDWDISKLWE